MKSRWQRFLDQLTPGVRWMLIVFIGAWLATLVGAVLHIDLYGWLALTGPKFLHGQIWRILTYAVLPFGILDLVMNCVALILLGGQLERFWSRQELWRYAAITAAGAGLVKVVLQPGSAEPVTGAAPMMFGLLAAWAFLQGRQRVTVGSFGEFTVQQVCLMMAGLSFLIMLTTAGTVRALVMIAGGLTGYGYLWWQQKRLMGRTSRSVHSERINRLEL
jgi:membrane associated rhomboid family serine protease